MDCRKITLSLALPLVAAIASAQSVTVDGKAVSFDSAPQMVNGTLMVPIKNLLEAMDVPMRYIQDRRVIEALRGGNKIEMWIGSSRARVNDDYMNLDEPSYVSHGRTFAPLKFVAEQLKYSVSYEHGAYKLTSMTR